MTFQKLHIPGMTDDELSVTNRLLEQLDKKSKRNLLRSSYYDGKRAIRQVGSVIPPQYYRLGVVLGWSAKAVDVLARRCNPDAIIWPDGGLDDLGLSDLAEDNNLMPELKGGLVKSLIHGTAFLITTKGDESKGEPAALLHVKDALSCTGDWNARLRRLDDVVSVTSRDKDGKIDGLVLYREDLTITADRDTDGAWQVEHSAHSWGVPVERLAYKPDRPFGRSRISRPVMSLHDQALRTVIRMEGHMDVYSYPEMWMLGADESIFKNADGSQRASWQIMLGRIKGIPDDEDAENPRADVKQFPASSPEPHIAALKQQAQLFSGETSIPLASLGVSDMSNPTSADSYIASREDLIAEAEGATDDWTAPIRRSITRLLAIANGESSVPASWESMTVKWRSPLHLSRAAAADAGQKQLAAIPWLAETEVGLELIGLSEQQIMRAQAERRRAAGRDVMAALVGSTPEAGSPAQSEAADIKAKADAMGVLIRAGVQPEDAAARVGLPGVRFTGAVPVSLRLPDSEASGLEEK